MKWFHALLLPLALVGMLACSSPASACPNCKDGLATGAHEEEDDNDPLRESRAYNYSIYFMVSMPYLLLLGFGALVGLSIARHRRLAGGNQPAANPVSPSEPPAKDVSA